MTIPNGTLVVLGAVMAIVTTPQSAHEAKVHTEGREGVWWHAWVGVHGHGASNGENTSREACAGTLAHIPNVMHKVPFLYCT